MKWYRVKWSDGSYSDWIPSKPYVEFIIKSAEETGEGFTGEIEEEER